MKSVTESPSETVDTGAPPPARSKVASSTDQTPHAVSSASWNDRTGCDVGKPGDVGKGPGHGHSPRERRAGRREGPAEGGGTEPVDPVARTVENFHDSLFEPKKMISQDSFSQRNSVTQNCPCFGQNITFDILLGGENPRRLSEEGVGARHLEKPSSAHLLTLGSRPSCR